MAAGTGGLQSLPVKFIVVLSDLHIGTGHPKGKLNVFDDFRQDARFEQLLGRYSSGKWAEREGHLVLNGDIFDLLKVPVNGQFPDRITERLALMKIEQCIKGHPRVIRALQGFLKRPNNRLTYQPGNHDMEFFFPGVQRAFTRAITGEDTHPRIRYISEEPFFTEEGGVQFHHGHQFEALHAMDFKRLFVSRGLSEPILNLPWGSLFVLHVVNRYLPERPYLDKVMPFWPIVAGGLAFDTQFTLRLLGQLAFRFGQARLNPVWWQKRPFESVLRFLRNDARFFEHLDLFAKKILKQPGLTAVFMGHSHMEMLRLFGKHKTYVNTGTWVPMVNFHFANLGTNTSLHYGFVDYTEDGEPLVSLQRWHGKRPIAEEVIY